MLVQQGLTACNQSLPRFRHNAAQYCFHRSGLSSQPVGDQIAMDYSTLSDVVLTWVTDQVVLLRPFAILGAAAASLIAITIVQGYRRARALRAELARVNARIDAMEAADYRKLMQSLRRPIDVDMTGLLKPREDEAMFPIAPSIASLEIEGQTGGKSGRDTSSPRRPPSAASTS